jgi:GNAT superfamily N-acetyltransferase
MKPVLREARAEDWAVCRALLPEACRRTDRLLQGMILHGEGGLPVVGAAVVQHAGDDAWISLRVVPALRRQGHGTVLFDLAIATALEAGAQRLRVACDVMTDPAIGPLLRRKGFSIADEITTYTADFARSASVLSRLRDALAARGRVPAGWAVCSLREAPHTRVAQLFAAYIADRADLAEAPIMLDHDMQRWQHSPVLLERGQPIAALLLTNAGSFWTVIGRFVIRDHQAGPANAVLLGAAADAGRMLGATEFRFESRPDNHDTLKLAERLQAVALHTRTVWDRCGRAGLLPA